MLKKIILSLLVLDVLFVAIFNSAFEESHAYIFIVVAFISLLLFLFLRKDDLGSIKLDYALVVIAVFLPVSTLFSFYKYITLLNGYIILSALIFYFILINILNEKSARFVMYSIVFIGLFVSAVGFFAYVLAAELPNSSLTLYFTSHSFLAGSRICSFFQYPNSFAGFLLMPFFLSLAFLWRSGKRSKIIWYVISAFLLFVLYLTGSRGAFLVFVLSVVLLYIFTDFKNYKALTHDLIVTIVIAISFVFINRKIFQPVILTNAARFKILAKFVAGEQNKSLSDRIQLAKDAINIFMHHPLLGTGLGTFKDAMLKYRLGLFFADEPHSMPFRILAETGVVGFVSFFCFFARGFLRGFKRNSFLYVALLSLFLHTFLDLDFAYPIIASLIFIGLALINYDKKFKSVNFNIHPRYISGLAIIALIIVSIIPNFAAATFANYGESLASKGEYKQALSNLTLAEKINPQNAIYHSRLGYCYEKIAFETSNGCDSYMEKSLNEYTKASKCNTLSFIYPLYMGNIYLLFKNPISLTLFKKSFSLNPLWKPILSDVALSAAYTVSKNREAVEYAKTALNFKADGSVYRSLRYTSGPEKDSRAYTALGFATGKKDYFKKSITLYPQNGFAYLGLSKDANTLLERVEYLRFTLETNPCIKEAREQYFSEAPLIKVENMKNLPGDKIYLNITILQNEELLKEIALLVRVNGKEFHVKTFPSNRKTIVFLLPKEVSDNYHIELFGIDKNGFTISKTISPLLSKKR